MGLFTNLIVVFIGYMLVNKIIAVINSPEYTAQKLEQNAIDKIFARDKDLFTKHPDGNTPYEVFNRSEWRTETFDEILIGHNNYWHKLDLHTDTRIFDPEEIFYSDEFHTTTIPRFSCLPDHMVFRVELKYYWLKIVRRDIFPKDKIPEAFYQLPDRPVRKVYQEFVDKYGPGIINRAYYGSKLVIDYYFPDPTIAKQYTCSYITDWIGIGLIDQIDRFIPKHLNDSNDIKLIKELLPKAKLLNFQVLGRAYSGDVLAWMDTNINQYDTRLIEQNIQNFEQILVQNNGTLDYSRIRNRVNDLHGKKIAADLPPCQPNISI